MSPPLESVELVLQPAPGPLLPQVRRSLAARLGPDAEALRWAITAVAPSGDDAGPKQLSIEAVVLRLPL